MKKNSKFWLLFTALALTIGGFILQIFCEVEEKYFSLCINHPTIKNLISGPVPLMLFLSGFIPILIELLNAAKDIRKLSSSVLNYSSTVNAKTVFINKKLDQILNKDTVGFFKKISAPEIWELEGKIVGWNPNWALELKAKSSLYRGLRNVHLKRIKHDQICEIEYFFDDRCPSDTLMFGSKYFLKFLKSLVDECVVNIEKQKLIKLIEKKYKIWLIESSNIPKDRYKEFCEWIEPYQDCIFVSGEKAENMNSLLFLNKNGFIDNGTHCSYFELFGSTENTFVGHMRNFICDLRTKLETFGVQPKTVVWLKDKFELK